ncbi:MAG: hypothetical protein H0V45_04820, partial [Actinobacteria bacterium]|nr:hypothetical protein [Actinomycetota bacterium]
MRGSAWRVVAATTVVGLLGGLAIALLLPSTYRAEGALVFTREGRAPGEVSPDDASIDRAVEAAGQLLRSRAVSGEEVEVETEEGSSLLRFGVTAGTPEEARRRARKVQKAFVRLYNARFGNAAQFAVWEEPHAGEEPVSPRTFVDLGLGGLLGVAIGVAVSALRRPRRLTPELSIEELPSNDPSVQDSLPGPEPPASPSAPEERLLEERIEAVTARELALARRAAELAFRERGLT